MNCKLLLAAGMVLLPVWSFAQETSCRTGQTEVKTDRFRSTVAVSAPFDASKAMNRLAPMLGAEFRPDKTLIQLIFMGSFDTWRYLKCHDTYLLADGNPVKPKGVRHDGSVSGRSVLESIVVDLDMDSLGQLAKAKTVEYKVCLDEFTASPEFVCDLKDFYEAMKRQEAEQKAKT